MGNLSNNQIFVRIFLRPIDLLNKVCLNLSYLRTQCNKLPFPVVNYVLTDQQSNFAEFCQLDFESKYVMANRVNLSKLIKNLIADFFLKLIFNW